MIYFVLKQAPPSVKSLEKSKHQEVKPPEQVKKDEIETLKDKIERVKNEKAELEKQLKAHEEASPTLAKKAGFLTGAAVGTWLWYAYAMKPVGEFLFPLSTGGLIGTGIYLTLYTVSVIIPASFFGLVGGVVGGGFSYMNYLRVKKGIERSIAEKQSEIRKLEKELTRLEKGRAAA